MGRFRSKTLSSMSSWKQNVNSPKNNIDWRTGLQKWCCWLAPDSSAQVSKTLDSKCQLLCGWWRLQTGVHCQSFWSTFWTYSHSQTTTLWQVDWGKSVVHAVNLLVIYHTKPIYFWVPVHRKIHTKLTVSWPLLCLFMTNLINFTEAQVLSNQTARTGEAIIT